MVIHILQEELKQSQKKRRESGSFVGSSQSLEGSSTLHWACKAGRVTEAEALLAAGAVLTSWTERSLTLSWTRSTQVNHSTALTIWVYLTLVIVARGFSHTFDYSTV